MNIVGRKVAREIELDRKHVAAMRALTLNPAHAPVDGMCLDELRMMALIRPVTDGYALTATGREQLQAEMAAAEERDINWRAGAIAQAAE